MAPVQIGLNLALTRRIAFAQLIQQHDRLDLNQLERSSALHTKKMFNATAFSMEADRADIPDRTSSPLGSQSPAEDSFKETPLRIPHRRRNTNGLIDLRTSTQRVPVAHPQNIPREHRRTQSLKLPILIHAAAASHSKQEEPRTIPSLAESKQIVAALSRQEIYLEFLHRNTFIGTASLDDFLSVLLFHNDHTTTIQDIIRAFSILAEKEQITVRQQSQHNEGWDLVRRVDPASANADYLSQAHIKLGSISLGEFMGYVGCDWVDGGIPVVAVANAFEMLARRDKDVEEDEMAKGREIRRRMLPSWL